jgi:two-component system response regulator YesN
MKKVFIADDEFVVRIGLTSNIPWEENGFVVCGVAKNGQEAIEKMKIAFPDILITDIQMPLVDGLSLIKAVKEYNKDMRTIIISHYEDFSYAKEAIKLGVFEYILKSDLTPELLLDTIKELSDVIDAEKQTNVLPEAPDITKKSSQADSFLLELINGRLNTQEEIDSFLAKSPIVFTYESFFFIICNIEKGEDDEDSENSSILLKRNFQEIVDQIICERKISLMGFVLNNRLISLFNIDQSEYQETPDKPLLNIADRIKKNICKFLNVDLCLGISSIGHSLADINSLFLQASRAQENSFFGTSKICIYKEPDLFGSDCPKLDLGLLKNAIQFVDIEQLTDYITSIFDRLCNTERRDFVYNVFIDFLSYAKIISNEINIDESKKYKPNYNIYEQLNNIKILEKYVLDVYLELISSTGAGKNGYSFTINKCKEYIKKNYMKNITLHDVADHVQLSKSYLSLLFKQETGINFSAYLKNYRIEKSKTLLKETNLKMYEVSEKVGLDNAFYFSKLFKEVTGISCRDYRKGLK